MAGWSLWQFGMPDDPDVEGFSNAKLTENEGMGLAAPDEGRCVAQRGIAGWGGRLPVNPSGRLKSKGTPIGATGVPLPERRK